MKSSSDSCEETFARAQQSQSHNVTAYRTDLGTLLGISRKKPPAFPLHLLSACNDIPRNPFVFVKKDLGDESGNRYSTSPILVSALPVVSQQKSVLNALLNNILLHHAGIDQDTLYAYGEVELVTFLSAYTMSHLLASVDPWLSFMSHSYRRYSALFFKLFNVDVFDGSGRNYFVLFSCCYALMDFHVILSIRLFLNIVNGLLYAVSIRPVRSATIGSMELNIVNGLLYAVSIRPVRSATIGSMEVSGSTDAEGNGLESKCLLPFAFWMNFIGKQSASKKAYKVIKELCPESSAAALHLVSGSTPIGEVPTSTLEEAFIIVKEELENLSIYKKYKEVVISKRST
ncbi:hypothetical protein DICVIV_03401 [Dictyocaulus viviparus]|uniref:Uncharacterized protein n=1 Tax=Dictyocaulus viviparus TaxID=29172 RepID=A0A0D8Y376_DICVI|nr:hypothetical protein DICVIV_03401 [Dictyocaulus viviparus]